MFRKYYLNDRNGKEGRHEGYESMTIWGTRFQHRVLFVAWMCCSNMWILWSCAVLTEPEWKGRGKGS